MHFCLQYREFKFVIEWPRKRRNYVERKVKQTHLTIVASEAGFGLRLTLLCNVENISKTNNEMYVIMWNLFHACNFSHYLICNNRQTFLSSCKSDVLQRKMKKENTNISRQRDRKNERKTKKKKKESKRIILESFTNKFSWMSSQESVTCGSVTATVT